MKNFCIHLLLFVVSVAILGSVFTLIAGYFDKKEYGPSTKEQIEKSFEQAVTSDAGIWFLGNSRIYRGIDPSIIQGHIAYNFGHDNDSFNQMYYKLLYLKEHNCRIDTLFLGVDYFQFGVFVDSRNYVYDHLFDAQYVKDYGRTKAGELANNIRRVFKSKQSFFFPSFTKYVSRGLKFKDAGLLPVLKENGQFIEDTEASENDTADRSFEVKEILMDYFDRILQFCKENDVEVYALMMPVRDKELACYTDEEINLFTRMINDELSNYGYNNRYLDYSNLPAFKDYSCYSDITHLNSASARAFTEVLWNDVAGGY